MAIFSLHALIACYIFLIPLQKATKTSSQHCNLVEWLWVLHIARLILVLLLLFVFFELLAEFLKLYQTKHLFRLSRCSCHCVTSIHYPLLTLCWCSLCTFYQFRQSKLLTRSTLRLMPALADPQRAHANWWRRWGGFARYLATRAMLLSVHLLWCFIHSHSSVAWLCLQEATQRVHLSSDSASSERGSDLRASDQVMEVC